MDKINHRDGIQYEGKLIAFIPSKGARGCLRHPVAIGRVVGCERGAGITIQYAEGMVPMGYASEQHIHRTRGHGEGEYLYCFAYPGIKGRGTYTYEEADAVFDDCCDMLAHGYFNLQRRVDYILSRPGGGGIGGGVGSALCVFS